MDGAIYLREDCSEEVQYDSLEYPVYIRRGLLSNYPNFAAPSHWHMDVEFIHVLEGAMTYQVNGEIIELHAGEGIFVNAGQLHFGYSIKKEECDFICILLHPMLLCAAPAAEGQFVLPLTQNATVPYAHLSKACPWQKEVLHLILQMYENTLSSQNPYLKNQALFFLLWDVLYENLAGKDFEAGAEHTDLTMLKNMVGFIQANFSQRISLEEIAMAGAVGQSKCCKLFRQYFSKTPMQYVNEYRLNKSADLLRESNLSVTEIALQTGFNDASYYTASFRKWSGLTPLAYRKQHR